MKLKFVALLAAAASVLAAPAAFAGSCPADQVLTQPREIGNVPLSKVSREVLANVRLEGWRNVGGFLLRMRRIELPPGGMVPTHSHGDRPSIAYVVKGTAIEHSAYCAVPVKHVAGEAAAEFGDGHTHWWENAGNEVVTFISADVVPYTGTAEPYVGIER